MRSFIIRLVVAFLLLVACATFIVLSPSCSGVQYQQATRSYHDARRNETQANKPASAVSPGAVSDASKSAPPESSPAGRTPQEQLREWAIWTFGVGLLAAAALLTLAFLVWLLKKTGIVPLVLSLFRRPPPPKPKRRKKRKARTAPVPAPAPGAPS